MNVQFLWKLLWNGTGMASARAVRGQKSHYVFSFYFWCDFLNRKCFEVHHRPKNSSLLGSVFKHTLLQRPATDRKPFSNGREYFQCLCTFFPSSAWWWLSSSIRLIVIPVQAAVEEGGRETCRGGTGRSRTAAIFAPYLSSDNNWISFIYSTTDLENTWETWFIWSCCSLSDLLGLANSSEGRKVKALGSITEISCTGQCLTKETFCFAVFFCAAKLICKIGCAFTFIFQVKKPRHRNLTWLTLRESTWHSMKLNPYLRTYLLLI